jgi:hypothetical protein
MSNSLIYPEGCPVDVEAKRWLERRLQWLTENLGAGSMAAGFRLVLPTSDELPVRFDGSPKALAALFERICRRMGLNAAEFTLSIEPENPPLWIVNDDNHPIPHGHAGLFEAHDGGARITINAGQLNQPAVLVATIAHELSHSVLHRIDPSPDDDTDRELLTDLTSIHHGFGIFAANSPRNWFSAYGVWPGTDLRMPRYLPCTMSTYALAVATVAGGDDERVWVRHLNQDAKTNVLAALRYLRATNDIPATLLDALKRASDRPRSEGLAGSVTIVDERPVSTPEPEGRRTRRAQRRGRIRMNGTWRGAYLYDAKATELRGFTMHLRDGWFGNFTGRALDDPPGPPDEAEVEGRIVGSQIVLTKSYAHSWVASSGKSIRYEEYLLEKHDLKVEGEIEGYDVEYTGEYDETRGAFEGTWRILTFERSFRANSEDYDLPGRETTKGRWTMTRLPNE